MITLCLTLQFKQLYTYHCILHYNAHLIKNYCNYLLFLSYFYGQHSGNKPDFKACIHELDLIVNDKIIMYLKCPRFFCGTE